jgi:hypothetical protein
MDGTSLARGLGWFSIVLGAIEAVAPQSITECLGVEGHEQLVRLFGAREIANGLGILAQDQPSPSLLWMRVGGDILDLAALGMALSGDGVNRTWVGASIAAVAGVTVLDVLCAQQLQDAPASYKSAVYAS